MEKPILLTTVLMFIAKLIRRNKVALIWEGENGDFRSLSYFALRRETCRFANVLRSLGVKKGDRVTIYMGRIPEIVTAMLGLCKNRCNSFRCLWWIFC